MSSSEAWGDICETVRLIEGLMRHAGTRLDRPGTKQERWERRLRYPASYPLHGNARLWWCKAPVWDSDRLVPRWALFHESANGVRVPLLDAPPNALLAAAMALPDLLAAIHQQRDMAEHIYEATAEHLLAFADTLEQP